MIKQSISIITIGDELLIGQIEDSNSRWLIREFAGEGFLVNEVRCVRDDLTAIKTALKDLSEKSGLIITTGGLGPTNDDMTKQAFAEFTGVKLVHNEQQWNHIVQHFKSGKYFLTDFHKKQASLPANVSLLNNMEGTALGLCYSNEENAFIMLPGVPTEMKSIMCNGGIQWMKTILPGKELLQQTFSTIGRPETWIAEKLKGMEDALPNGMTISYLPSTSGVKVRLTSRKGEGTPMEEKDFTAFAERVYNRIKETIYAREDISIEAYIGKLLRSEGKLLASAESCTGGYLAHRLTRESGASDFYKGSIIAYHNDVKHKNLNISEESLKKHGAVSEEVVTQMALNICKLLSCDYGIAISGIAGPRGGSADKPVGTAWIGIADKEGDFKVECLHFGGTRQKNIELSTSSALNLLRKFLLT